MILDPRYKDCYFDTALRATAINELQQEVHKMTTEEDGAKTPAQEEELREKRPRMSEDSPHFLSAMFNEILEERQRLEELHTPQRSPAVVHVNFKYCTKMLSLRLQVVM